MDDDDDETTLSRRRRSSLARSLADDAKRVRLDWFTISHQSRRVCDQRARVCVDPWV